jgi:hypothetical protein
MSIMLASMIVEDMASAYMIIHYATITHMERPDMVVLVAIIADI